MKRLKIVQCFFTFETGGAQILALELLNEMCHDHDVSLIVINNEWNKELLGLLDKRVQVYLINRKAGARNPMPLIKLNIILFKLRPDIIHCHEPNAARIIRTRHAKLLYTIHDVDIPTSNYHLYNILIAISNAVYKDVVARCDLPVKKVYNGIPMNSFTQRKNYTLKQNEPVKLVQLSRLMHEKKGQDILLRALYLVVHEYNCSGFSLDFIGSGESYEYLKDLVQELDLVDYVCFCGEKDRNWLFSNLSAYHVLIQPSRYEGFGLTILEGFAAGLPVLASNIDGPAEILFGMPGGFLFENENIASCAKELFYLITLYRETKVNDLMSKTIPFIREKYSINTCTKEYLMEYDRLITKPAAPIFMSQNVAD